ncbi:Dipeptidyl aminopeptidase/acylaminoacyl peptidase [Halogranum gelatinilyticum]|uniref:Dipeptidyl aminopeptidase/acylaminoacyl peptidase n=1 Tax=Halogranum gelatinilyticum TaxID=660521 RepID=A0A1G9NSB6_9EURY|nr:S9 family peptidase [Halogranum gelatinilyticum]SDL89280.1 Dipeptidyl aminopeptidase/acylaminoacyl peptidase [Halogranum gelatinilyticum]
MNPITAADFHGLVKPSDPRLSPDGERVAFVRSVPTDDETYESTVYVVDSEGGDSRQFTVAEGVDSQPRWSPSGDRLAFVSTRGADDDRPQLWVMPTDGGEARQVTDVPGGVVGPVWSPDGTRIAFTQAATEAEREEGLDLDIGEEEEYERETPDPRVVDRLVYRQGAKYIDGTRSHVYVLDLASEEETLTRLTDGDYDHNGVEWGDATTLYYASKRTDPTDDSVVVDVLASDTEAGTEELVTQTTGWGAVLAATEDGRVAYPRTPEEGLSMRGTDLEVYDRATGETTVLTADLDRTVDLTAGIAWDPSEERLGFVTPDEGRVVVRTVASDGTELKTVVGEGHVSGFSVGDDAVAVARSEWDHPGDVFVAGRSGDHEPTRLTKLNADYLAAHEVRKPEELRFDSDGHEIQGWLLTPPGFDEREADETYPLAVEIHGGPHAMWSTAGTMWHEFQTLAARGYVVFWSNPRGSTGYGEAHSMAIERDWGAVTMADVMAGVDLVCERDGVDADDAFVTGGSFGGFMTGWIVGQTDFFTGAVAQRGVYDLSSFYGSTDAFKLVEWDFGTTPWDDPAFLWEQSPVARADEVTTPTLVIHADNDFRVPVNNGEMFYLFLKKAGVDTRLVRYPREGHELSRSGEPGHIVDRIERIVRWFDGYSAHHDVPRALDRGDDGLSAGEETGNEDDADAGEDSDNADDGEDGGDDAGDDE